MLLPATTAFGRATGRRRRHHGFFPFLRGQWKERLETLLPRAAARSFRSEAALDALRHAAVHGVSPPAGDGDEVCELGRGGGRGKADETASVSDNGASTNGYSLVLYNYPSFTGALAALFARRYHSVCRLPALFLPFSSVEPFRVEDLKLRGLETCYLLDFIGPDRFAVELSRFIPNVVAFDHRKSAVAQASQFRCSPENLKLHIDMEKSSARAVYDYFSKKLENSPVDDPLSLLNQKDKDCVDNILKYIEDSDLRQWKLLDTKAFNIGLKEKYSMLNCVTNPYVFKQCIRADGHSNLSHELADDLSKRSAAAGLRYVSPMVDLIIIHSNNIFVVMPIGAVVFMQRGNLKMCLRTTDTATDTSELAKAYGGGGKPSSSSFIIRMDEYNHWTFANLEALCNPRMMIKWVPALDMCGKLG
ncbi:hypothetical protein Taro_006206 [Colocasia esculenta]|uniref:Uncharacterized protein n=1 Tax=Colocasia esculenta TaxID=4460 RepID=A0A843U059_COLES|nr:hypothetical protein [Colocasia esculenta]